MKKLYIICDGGLGNHVNGMISGLVLAEKLNRIPIVVWPITNVCEVSYYELWEKGNFEIIESTISNFFKNTFTESYDMISYGIDRLKSFPFIDTSKITNLVSNIDEQIYQFDFTNDNLVYYYCRKIQPFLWNESGEKLRSLKIKKHFVEYVKDFIIKNDISPEHTNGMHLRLTDSNRTINPEYLESLIKNNQDKKFYVCSCSEEMENKLKIYKNVITNPKKEYVKKLIDGSWMEWTTDQDGRRKKSNICIGNQAVLDAFKDLLILSKTNILETTDSAFRDMAIFYKNYTF